MTPGHITGTTTQRKAWKRVQPSTMALSSRSLGIDRKKECIIHSVKGCWMATSTMMAVGSTPHMLSWKKGSR